MADVYNYREMRPAVLGLWHRNKGFHQGQLCSINHRQSLAKCLIYGAKHQFPVAVAFWNRKNLRASLKVSNRFHRTCQRSRKIEVHSRPLTHIKLSPRENVERPGLRQEFHSSRLFPLEKLLRGPRSPFLLVKWESLSDGGQLDKDSKYVPSIGEREKCIRFSSDQQSLHGWSKNRRENRRNGSYCCPSIPVHGTCFTKPPALTYSIQHTHSGSSLWIELHSAMRVNQTEANHG
ncbi:hypothetical protein [Stenotrophomonas maltophilia]|uniref:hypothetical protein n=1 Tax=Stenotrophomonas maltophilia TaxID=40324 RepID=UPI0039F7127A